MTLPIQQDKKTSWTIISVWIELNEQTAKKLSFMNVWGKVNLGGPPQVVQSTRTGFGLSFCPA
jgi:hypothetical protein